MHERWQKGERTSSQIVARVDRARSRIRAEPAAVLALAAILRIVGIGRTPLWQDEANTVLISWMPLSDISKALSRDGNPPVYYMLLHFWMKLFGATEVAARSLSSVFGIFCVGAIYLAARTLLPQRRWAALAASSIAAVSPLAIYYSQECRMYTLTPLLGLVAFVTLHEALCRRSIGLMLAHAVTLAAGLYSHNYFIFLVPLGPTIALLVPGKLGRTKALLWTLGAAALAILLYSPWIPILMRQSRSGVDAWIPGIWKQTPPAMALLRSVEVMGVAGAYPNYLRHLSHAHTQIRFPGLWATLRIIGNSLAVLFLAIGLTSLVRRRAEREIGFRLGLFFVMPLVVPYLVSFVVKPIYLVGRYEMVAFTAFAVLVGAGFDAAFRVNGRMKRIGAFASVILWVGAAAVILVAALNVKPNEEDRSLALWLRENTRATDIVVFPGYTRVVPEYYRGLSGAQGTWVSFPEEVALHPGWFDHEKLLRRPDETQLEAKVFADHLSRTRPAGGRVLVVASALTPPKINEWLVTALAGSLGKLNVYRSPPNYVVVFDPQQ